MSNWEQVYSSKLISAKAATDNVKNGARIFLGSMAAEPGALTRALASSPAEDVQIIQFKASEASSRLAAKGTSRFRLKTFFVGRRDGLRDSSQADYVPLFHSEIPLFFESRTIPIDVAMIQVSPPDGSGRVSLGVSVDITRSAVESARMVIAQVNPRMPRTHGDTVIPLESIDYLVEEEEQLLELQELMLTDADRSISRFCSELIEDGSILQTGFAGISQGLIDHLKDRKNLGVHSEMFTDSLIDLIEAGVVTNSTKEWGRGKSVATFCLGTRRLYEYVHENPLFEFHPSEVVLNPSVIARNKKMVAVNVAVKVDLRGQIRQGSLGWTAFEGSGGDHDFMRGASLSENGRSIVCLRSTDPAGNSNIVAHFGPRAAVIMNRGDVQYVVTEFGIAYLGGKSIRERTLALVEIAHPDHRELLMTEARELGYVYPDQVYVRLPSPDLRARIRTDRVFKDGLKAHIRAVKSTDESMLRDLFYHLSENSVYFRYFSPRRSMPHKNVQQYVNLEEDKGISIVVTIGPRENRRMIAEGRYVLSGDDPFPDVAIMVDEEYHGRGIGTFLLNYLAEIAKERGIEGFRADVLTSNSPMLKIVERLPYASHTAFQDGVFAIRFRFDEFKEADKRPSGDPSS